MEQDLMARTKEKSAWNRIGTALLLGPFRTTKHFPSQPASSTPCFIITTDVHEGTALIPNQPFALAGKNAILPRRRWTIKRMNIVALGLNCNAPLPNR